jgi:hypothetical protein
VIIAQAGGVSGWSLCMKDGKPIYVYTLISIPMTQTPVNPARSTGVAVYVGGWAAEELWLSGSCRSSTRSSEPLDIDSLPAKILRAQEVFHSYEAAETGPWRQGPIAQHQSYKDDGATQSRRRFPGNGSRALAYCHRLGNLKRVQS